jgi:hypothetical protein
MAELTGGGGVLLILPVSVGCQPGWQCCSTESRVVSYAQGLVLTFLLFGQNGISLYLWVGRAVDPAKLSALFGVSSLEVLLRSVIPARRMYTEPSHSGATVPVVCREAWGPRGHGYSSWRLGGGGFGDRGGGRRVEVRMGPARTWIQQLRTGMEAWR